MGEVRTTLRWKVALSQQLTPEECRRPYPKPVCCCQAEGKEDSVGGVFYAPYPSQVILIGPIGWTCLGSQESL